MGLTPQEVLAAKEAQYHLDIVTAADNAAILVKEKAAADAQAEIEAKARYLRPNGGLQALQAVPGRYCP